MSNNEYEEKENKENFIIKTETEVKSLFDKKKL
jgi:hypothetical protein